MNLKQLVVFFAILGVSISNSFAQRSVDFRAEYESWNSGISNNSKALLLGLGGYYQYHAKWSVSGGLVTGDYSINEDNAELSRTDMDFAIGYLWRNNISAFAGYRFLRIRYDNNEFNTRSFTDLTHGPGIGANIIQPIKQQWFGYTRIMSSLLQSNLKLKDQPTDKGLGLSFGVEGGLIYSFNPKSSIGLSLKYQNNIIDYKNDSNSWNHDYLRFGVSLSHSI